MLHSMSSRLAPPPALKSSQSSRVNEPLNTQRNGNTVLNVFIKGTEGGEKLQDSLLKEASMLLNGAFDKSNWNSYAWYDHKKYSVSHIFTTPRLDLAHPQKFKEQGFTNLIVQATNVSADQETLNEAVDPRQTLGLMSKYLPEVKTVLQEAEIPVLSMQMMYDDSRYINLLPEGKDLVDRFGEKLKQERSESGLLKFGKYTPNGNNSIVMMTADPKNLDNLHENQAAIEEGVTLFKGILDTTLNS